MPHHALEIVLTRPATRAELTAAARLIPLAANSDRTRLLAVLRATTPGKALHRARHRLDQALPLDILTTHYPGQVLLNVHLPTTARRAIQHAAKQAGHTPPAFLRHAVLAAVNEADREAAHRLDTAVDHLLAETTPQLLLAAAARALVRHPHADKDRA